MTEIEELPQTEEEQKSSEEKNHREVNLNPIRVNKVPIGEACSPYEVIQVQTESGLFPVVIIYDTGSEVSLCNYETGPIVTNAKKGNKKVTISTINSVQPKLRQVYSLSLKEGSHNISMEAITFQT